MRISVRRGNLRRSMRSHSRVAKKLSAIALPQHSPTEPVDAMIPVSRQRFSSSYDA